VVNGARSVYLYGEPAIGELDTGQLASYVTALLPGLHVEARPAFVEHHLSSLFPDERQVTLGRLARAFAQAKVSNPLQSERAVAPLAGEVDYERRRLEALGIKTFGLLYDGIEVMHVLGALIPPQERGLDSVHIILTNQLLGTWEAADCRYHARVVVFGYPSIISTSGVVEAPARPREYYVLKQRYQALGMQDAAVLRLGDDFRGRFLDYGDSRLAEVMKGYVAQSLFYHLSGDPFCENEDCRLYNAHWQEEVIRSQIKAGSPFCSFHEKELQNLGGSGLPG
jgi:hypothetical protein